MIPVPDPRIQVALKDFRDDLTRIIVRRLIVEPLLQDPNNQGYLQGVLLDTLASLTAIGEKAKGVPEPPNSPMMIAEAYQQRWFYWRGALAGVPTDPQLPQRFLIEYLEGLLNARPAT